ncbi:MAG TPA: ParM/StbA family protein [Clostridia bacterium]|nr:ParM/StbA family protein [Clostridia bacterium]
MKSYQNAIIIGIDHGYGNIKTANCCFKTGVTAYNSEPTFKENLLIWNDKYYLISEEHKEFSANKMLDSDYYVLTLAAVARELNISKTYTANIFIAAGLPLTWVSQQKEEFKKYLVQNEKVDFVFKGKEYHIRIIGADVYPQGFAAIVNNLRDFNGVNMLCDIGNGTMNVMFVNDKKPDSKRCFTEKFGTNQCLLAIRENVMRFYHSSVDDSVIARVLRFGTADIDEYYLKTIIDTAKEYVEGIFRRLREHEYDARLMRLYVVGGGGCLIKNFGNYNESRVTINDDICATAKGYERMLEMKLLRSGGKV